MTKASNEKRLIEVAFPLEATSIDSVHEKNVRHGHISTLHIWPARRPLAACRAALIATLLPDPGDPEKRAEILRRLAGEVVEEIEETKKGAKRKRVTKGGILHWGRENGPDLQWFRDRIREAHGGRAPRVLDPFAGGGAIPLEAMRLGCEATAIDINPVAWFILKCTLEYPQKLAGQTRPLPAFALADREFVTEFLKAKGFKGAKLKAELARLGHRGPGLAEAPSLFASAPETQADLAWHVRAWGRWVLAKARRELAALYPIYADFEALKEGKEFAPRPMQLVELNDDGTPDLEGLNAEFDERLLADPRNPRWVAKPTVAYLWARTVRCKGCRAEIPLLKTRWLCRKDNKRVLLTMTQRDDRTGVKFGIQPDPTIHGGNAAQRRDAEKKLGAGTMSRAGVQCPCCPTIMTMEDLRHEGKAGRIGSTMTAVVVDGLGGKEYRLPTEDELTSANVDEGDLAAHYEHIPFGVPGESLPSIDAPGIRVPLYGLDRWRKLFTNRQMYALGSFIKPIRELTVGSEQEFSNSTWIEGIQALLACSLDRVADSGSSLAHWQSGGEFNVNTFQRFALPVNWDFSEINPTSGKTGNFLGAVEWVARVTEHTTEATKSVATPTILACSAIDIRADDFDAIVTDPPYYDAIPYSDLMDFFYVWLRRAIGATNGPFDSAFAAPLGPKWNNDTNDGELIDDASRFDGDKARSKANYENGMSRVFGRCHSALNERGRLVVVFANKNPEAWETLVAALVRAGFVVDGSWPIRTERETRTRAMASAALSSSVWLVCRKRETAARPGWDNKVLDEMRANIRVQLREFWDAGIRGPDFVWAATGPALEAFSRHPVVRKASTPDETMTVSEFLRAARRMVVDFVVGRVLTHGAEDGEAPGGLDDVTTYYLLHRHTFGIAEAPIGAAILYALSCNLSDRALADQHDLLARKGAQLALDEEEDAGEEDDDTSEETEPADGGGKGETVRLKGWQDRKGKLLGLEGPGGSPAPLIDQIHRLMRLWKVGEVEKVDEFLDARALARSETFRRVLQAVLELAQPGTGERELLEAISNHIGKRANVDTVRQGRLTV